MKPLAEQVVVITGASSGIGRETALHFAQHGARVALVARNQEALAEVESEIIEGGGQALAIPADVSDWDQVQHVAQQAVERLGRIDTWVNNAAVTLYSWFEDVTPQEFKRVIDVNLMGQVYGARAALPYLKMTQGTLIGIGSVESELPVPLQTPYVASKHALKGFYDTLRLEQEHAQTGVQVSFLMPASIDTPLFDHALSHLGYKPRPLPPVYDPRIVADAILYAAQKPVRDMAVGGGGALLARVISCWPRAADAALQRIAYRGQLTQQPELPTGPNNLWQPMPGKGSTRGGFSALSFDPYTWIRLRPTVLTALAGAALTALLVPLAGLWMKRNT